MKMQVLADSDAVAKQAAKVIAAEASAAEKAPMLARLLSGDVSIPAGRVRQDQALVLADLAAAGKAELDLTKGNVCA